jgi:hypothetical protein
MIYHVENLAFADPSRVSIKIVTGIYFFYHSWTCRVQEDPNAYVKVYLHPDHTKQTKRKTKVVKKSCNPTFMEMLEYRMPIEYVR